MRAHIRSRIGVKTIGDQGFGGCLPYAQRRYKKRSARSTWEATVENGTIASATSGARALRILSIVIVVVENEVRFVWWLFLFQLCLIKGVPLRCSRVALAASLGASSNVQERCFRCDVRVFSTSVQACRTLWAMRRFMGPRRRSSTASCRHLQSIAWPSV